MVRSAWIFFALCLVAQASCEYFSFGYPDVGNRASELVYTTGYAEKMDSTSTYVMHLYKNPPGFEGGVVYKKTPVTTAHNGFTTKFTYAPTMCQTYFPSYAGGFAFFLTSSNISATPKIGNLLDAFGLNAMSDVIMAGYTVTTNEFMICNWTDAPTNTRLYNLCPRNPSPDPPYNCTGLNNANHTDLYEFTVIYDTKTLSIYVDDILKFSYPVKLQPVSYTIGFAANIGVLTNSVYRQDITNWNFTSLDGPATESFKYDGRLSSAIRTAEQFTVIGSAQLKANSIQIVPSSQYVTGAVLLRGGVPAYRGFRTRFNWAASECNSDGNGDGFAFFVSQAQPTKGVFSSFGDGLGILNHRDSIILGFSSFYNEFRYCNRGVPKRDWKGCTITDNLKDPVQCNDHLVEILFDGTMMKMYYDDDLVLYDNSLKLDKGLYFVGIAAANGDSYFRQDITEWTYDNLPSDYTFDYPVFNRSLSTQFDVFNARWTPSSVMLTDTSQNQTGVIVTRTPFQAHSGFEITFNWVSTITKAVNSSLNGLTIFLSKTYPTARQVSESGKSGRGVLTLPNTYAIVIPMNTKNVSDDGFFSYSTEYSLCKWRVPYTSVANMTMDCITDPYSGSGIHTGTVTQYTIRYDGKTLDVYARSSQLYTLRAKLTMDWSDYYIGIAATSSIGFMQEIRSLKFKSYHVDIQHHTFNIFNPGDMLLYSDAIIDYQLRLTNPVVGSVGAVVYPSKVDAYFGFQTTFSYKSTDCRSARTPPSQ